MRLRGGASAIAAMWCASLAVAAMVIAACAMSVPPSPSPPTSTPGPVAPIETPTSPPPALDPNAVGLTCGDGVAFHPAFLDATGSAQLDPDDAAAALRQFLQRPEGVSFGADSWVRIGQTGAKAQFLGRRNGSDELVYVAVALRDGAWTFDSAGGCRPEVALPAGVSRAEWRLDPAFPDPEPEDRVIHVLINERACASGRSPEGRVLPPSMSVSAEAVTIGILVESRPGGQDCPGNPDFPIEIELPEPLAGRPLFDGGTFPPTGPVAHYALTCDVEDAACRALAVQIVADAEREHLGRRVTWVYLYDMAGNFDLVFDDGTTFNRHP